MLKLLHTIFSEANEDQDFAELIMDADEDMIIDKLDQDEKEKITQESHLFD